MMARVEPEIKPVTVGIIRPGKRIEIGTAVDKGNVVGLLKGVFDDFPVGANIRGPAVASGGMLAKGIIVETFTELAIQTPPGFIDRPIDALMADRTARRGQLDRDPHR